MTCFLNALVYHHPVLLSQPVDRILHLTQRAVKPEEIGLQERCPKLVRPPIHRHPDVTMQKSPIAGKSDQVSERVV